MKIGFIDYKLNNYHSTTFHRLLTDVVDKGEHTIVGAYETNPEGEDWCAKTGVKRLSSAAEVIDKSEAVIVLAPNDVDRHLELARLPLASGKPVLIDKNLSNTVQDAREIARLAKEGGSPFMSSSSLRFSAELEELLPEIAGKQIQTVFSRGFGKWRGYSVHTIAPALRLINRPIKRLIDTGRTGTRLVTLDCGDICASIDVRESSNNDATPWQLGVLADDKYYVVTITRYEQFYTNLMHEAVRFFKTRVAPLSPEEMIQEVAVEVGADESLKQGGAWVSL